MTERAPGLNRRDFMRLGLVAPAALVAACGWDGGPVLEPRLRAISRLNDWVGEKILLSPTRLAPRVSGGGAHRRGPVPGLLHHPQPHRQVLAARRRGVGARGRRPGAEANAAHPADDRGASASDLHREAPLRGGVDRDRNLDRRPGLARGRHGAALAGGAPPPVRLVRQPVLQWLGPRQRHAPADDPGVCLQRSPAHGGPRSAAEAVLADQTGVQDDEVPDGDDVHARAAGGYWEDQGYPWLGGV